MKNLGGRALTAHILTEEVDPTCDPLGPENKLIIAGMLLGGTTISTSNRLSFGTKSPLTGGIKESNVGGTAGSYLAGHGIKALILEDAPEENTCHLLLIKADGAIELHDAISLSGKGNYEIVETMQKRYGAKISVISNGIAGERQYLNSSIQVTEMGIEKPCRAAARGGVGAVLGSKGIKVIVIEKPALPYKMKMVDETAFRTASKKVTKAVLDGRGMLSDVGTAGIIGATIPMAIAPYRNFNGGQLTAEEEERFNVQTIVERIRAYGGSTGHACQAGCVVKCSNIVNDRNGTFLTAGFEYETIELFGPNCAIFDIDMIAACDRFCDDYGFDTIELGASLGVYMDAGEISWADTEGVLNLFKSFYGDNPVADDFGAGTQKLGEKLGVKRIPTVKGQAIPAYDPRNLKGTGAAYAISPMGADHTCGASLSRKDLPPTGKSGQLEFAVNSQGIMAACDSNVCLFAWAMTASAGEEYANAVSAALGGKWSFEDILTMGKQCVEKEQVFNRRAGILPDDDRLPAFFYQEASSATGAVFDITHEEVEEMWHHRSLTE
ncbi:aldehyde:ferredoxin oxidoreductase [Anoxynatronum buryatiense]|uniref:Aldehyde:ferredoxin oxidoreductase n=2 Tax=Anoxynatronum buryatiense TaxID=489973 RepID=A0AA45WU08_9CLOT|nr:aldehyde:ferredoxin oxidoreductase [Anoxynatronum buryatiense]